MLMLFKFCVVCTLHVFLYSKKVSTGKSLFSEKPGVTLYTVLYHYTVKQKHWHQLIKPQMLTRFLIGCPKLPPGRGCDLDVFNVNYSSGREGDFTEFISKADLCFHSLSLNDHPSLCTLRRARDFVWYFLFLPRSHKVSLKGAGKTTGAAVSWLEKACRQCMTRPGAVTHNP